MNVYPKSDFEIKLEKDLLARVKGKSHRAFSFLLAHKPLEQLMGFCNVVSVERYGLNDHGRVHAKIATINALKILDLLLKAKIEPNVVKEKIGDQDDARLVTVVAAFLHDLGMSIGREAHELNSVRVGDPFIFEVLREIYDDEGMVYVLRSYIFEAIMGHMAHMKFKSIESGVVLVSDGCDMEFGRARAALKRKTTPAVGDIHAYSALSVSRVEILKGKTRPLEIFVRMKDNSGLFQVEETLLGKISASSINPYIQVSVQVGEQPKMHYRI